MVAKTDISNRGFGNGSRTYSAYGSPLTITTSKAGVVGLPSLSYSFNDATGMLTWRKDSRSGNVQENFTYDNMWRLKNYGSSTTDYSAMGNITYKTDAGTLEYTDSSHPFQITGQTNFPPTFDTDPRTATFTSFERPATLAKSGYSATFLYNHAGERTKMTVTGIANYTRIYLGGNYEHEHSPAGGAGGGSTTERLYLGGTAYDAPAVAIRTNGGSTWDVYYIHRDYLGSIVALTNSSGTTVAQSNSYDAWGNRTLVSGTQIIQRGYTGHEHLPEFGLINMNARQYDPVIGRFLSPDPYVQNPYFSQSYNRYAYCWNNPLIYTDPSGMISATQQYLMDTHCHNGGSFWYRGELYIYSNDAGSGGGGGWVCMGSGWNSGGGSGFGGGAVYQKIWYEQTTDRLSGYMDKNGNFVPVFYYYSIINYWYEWTLTGYLNNDQMKELQNAATGQNGMVINHETQAYANLTSAEKSLVRLHPLQALSIHYNMGQAFKVTGQMFPGQSAHNNAADAFRHAYFNALNTRSVGHDLAYKFGVAHEAGPRNPALERGMDLINNVFGINAALRNPCMSNAQLANYIYNAVTNGQLVMIQNGRLVPTY